MTDAFCTPPERVVEIDPRIDLCPWLACGSLVPTTQMGLRSLADPIQAMDADEVRNYSDGRSECQYVNRNKAYTEHKER